MATTYEIFCERCGTRHVDKPAPAARAGRLRGLLRNNSERKAETTHADTAFDGSFLRVCLGCRGYACGNCWNDESGFCLDCAPGDEATAAPPAADMAAPSAPADEPGSWAGLYAEPDQFVDTATPTVSDWPATDLTDEEWDQANAPDDRLTPPSDTWPTQDLAVVEPYPLLAEMTDPSGQAVDTTVEASVDRLDAGTESPAEIAGHADDAQAADAPDSDLLSEGPNAEELPLFELSAILAQFSSDGDEAVGEAEPVVEAVAAVEAEPAVDEFADVEIVAALESEPVAEELAGVGAVAAVETEPVDENEPAVAEPLIQATIDLELEPRAEMIIPVEPEPAVEMVAEVAAEPEPASTLPEPAPIPMPAPPAADVIWPPAGPAGYRPDPDSTPAIQPVLAFHPSTPRRRTSSPTAVAARRPLPRELTLVTTVPQIRDCPNCQLPISVRARFCRRCGCSQVGA